jgi:hypothetical protein
MERLDRDKHSGLLRISVNYGRKSLFFVWVQVTCLTHNEVGSWNKQYFIQASRVSVVVGSPTFQMERQGFESKMSRYLPKENKTKAG